MAGENLRGKTAVIIGGARGIGLACAQRLAADGARAVLWDSDLAEAQAQSRTLGNAHACKVDVSNEQSVTAALADTEQRVGPVDILVPVSNDEELVLEANVSRGALVASIATDDPKRGAALADRLDAFKVGL